MMYLLGQFTQRASIIKFSKTNVAVDWKLEIVSSESSENLASPPLSEMNEIYSYVQPENSNSIYACGYKWDKTTDEEYSLASAMKVDERGKVSFLYVWNQRLPGATFTQMDMCKQVSYDSYRKELVFLLEVTSSSLRPSYSAYSAASAANKDILIVTMKESGQFMKGININMDTSSVSMILGSNSLFVRDGNYIFGGFSYGYSTKFHNVTYDLVTPTYDSFVFKYD